MSESKAASVTQRDHITRRLEAVEKVFGKAIYRKVLDNLQPKILAQIYEGADSDWIPTTLAMDVNDAVCKEVGEDGVYKLSREFFGGYLNNSTLTRLFMASLRLVKIRPLAMTKLVSQFWESLYKDGGDMRILKADTNHIELILDNLPTDQIIYNRASYFALAGGVHAVFEAAGIAPRKVGVREVTRKDQVVFIINW